MPDLKIAVIVGSTRPGRLGSSVGEWVYKQTQGRSATYDLLELADFDLDLLKEERVPGAAQRDYENAKTRAWGAKIDEYDGFVFVTPEYNHGVPAALKNAFDVLYPEWNNKAAGFVAYGADGGVRSVEQWRTITINSMLYTVRAQVSLSLFTDFGENGLEPQDRRAGELATLFDQVEQLAGALRTIRS